MRKLQRARRRRGAFSLIEVMIALGILAFGLLGVAAMQITALGNASKGRHLSTAAMIARDQMEKMQRVPFSQIQPKAWGAAENWMAGVGLVRGNMTTNVDQVGGGTAVEHTYNVDWQITAVAPVNQDLLNIELAVTWVEKDQTVQRAFGLSSIVVDNSR